VFPDLDHDLDHAKAKAKAKAKGKAKAKAKARPRRMVTLVTPVLQVAHRVITRHLLGQAGLKPEEADSGAVALIQRFGSAAKG
jgi:hypothetical protein